ncbi:MAG: pyruvate formate lyase family protein, partial [Candidatus Cryosericum sp.]
MNERVARLRQESLDAVPRLSLERAHLVTEFDRQVRGLSAPVYRAQLLQYILEHKQLYIGPDELIAGERGPAPKVVPTFPELCCHSMEDLTILDTREKISYKVDDEGRRIQQEEVIPTWRGRSMRDRIFALMQPEWKDAYEAGVFTEFMEQRAPGHTVLGDVIYHKGLLDLKAEVEDAIVGLDFLNDPQATARREELRAMSIAADAMMGYAERNADLARSMADMETDPMRRAELLDIADVCSWVPAHAPRTFREALQAYWFVHLGVVTELNTWDSFCPGRLDQ